MGFFLSLIAFSLGHYFSHPEWNLLAVLNTVPGGIALSLCFYATGSLLVSMVTHTLMNLVGLYAMVLYAKESFQASYIVIASLGVFFLVLCLVGKGNQRQDFAQRTSRFWL